MAALQAIEAGCQFHAVRRGDLDYLEQRHSAACDFISRECIGASEHFPNLGDDFPVFFYLESRGHVCAYLRTIPDEVASEGRTYPWAWTADNFTIPEFRGRGLSTQLQGQATHFLHQLGIGRGSVFSTDVSLHIFRKLGFKIVGYAPRHLLLRRLSPLLQAHVRRPTIRRVLATLAAPVTLTAMTGLRLWNAALRSTAVEVYESSLADAELQPLLDRLAGQRSLNFAMRRELLSKKFEVAVRTGAMSLFLMRHRQSGDLVGYAIVRQRHQKEPLAEKYRDFRLMTLMDFAIADDDRTAATALVAYVVGQFLESDCDVLEIISNNRLINQVAKRCCMLPVGKGMSFAYSAPEDWHWPAA